MRDRMDEIISFYGAEQAVEDGILFDVTDLARRLGFKVAVRITAGVRALCEETDDCDGCLANVVSHARLAVIGSDDFSMSVFEVRIGARPVKLWALPDTTSGAAIHIILPEEY